MSRKNLIEPSSPTGKSAWVGTCAVFAAALAMAATIPGRTHGLGMITEPLLDDFAGLTSIGQSATGLAASLPFNSQDWSRDAQNDTHAMRAFGFATMNFWATILGSVLCIPCGWLLDRYRIRTLAAVVVLALALTVIGMSRAHHLLILAVTLTLTRCFGQSMLSVVSLAIIGKSFPRRPGLVMGLYAVLMTIFMVLIIGLLRTQIPTVGWRETWWNLGLGLAIVAPFLFLLTPWRLTGNAAGQMPRDTENELTAATLSQAMASPCFWTFALAISLFGLISSGFSLFQESIFAAQGLDQNVYYNTLIVGLGVGLLANLFGGCLAITMPLHRLLCGAMLLLAISLAGVPFVTTANHAYLFCLVYGMGGGVLTVLFFTVWGPAFGTRSLARIQGAAQMLTVLASAAGPLCVSGLRLVYGSDKSFLFVFSGASLLLGLAALFVPVPSAARGDWDDKTTQLKLKPNPLPETAR